MNIIEVKDRTLILIEKLVELWEKSVKETHLFLSEDEIESIKMYVPQALKDINTLIVVENEVNCPIAFMGVQDEKLEMLFILPKERGKGLGKKLLQYGIENYSIKELTVNEQNPLAKGFYEYMGFKVYKRTEYDEQGQPYPLLYMRLN
ncbi:MAG: GNAT family N-acetyltransferase [Lachnospirales bacterium]